MAENYWRIIFKLPPAFFESRREFVQHPVTFLKKQAGCFLHCTFARSYRKGSSSLLVQAIALSYLFMIVLQTFHQIQKMAY